MTAVKGVHIAQVYANFPEVICIVTYDNDKNQGNTLVFEDPGFDQGQPLIFSFLLQCTIRRHKTMVVRH
jgi:hypothetical protein